MRHSDQTKSQLLSCVLHETMISRSLKRSRFTFANRTYSDTTNAKNDKPEQSAMAKRFEQILDQQLSNSSSSSLHNSLDDIHKAYGHEKESFERAKVYIKSEPILQNNKHARDIFNAQPWTGTESVADVNLRLIVDSKPPAIKITTPKRGAAKLESAMDSSLDYKLNKSSISNNTKNSDSDNFKELYRERLLGPSMLFQSSPSIDLINNIASSKINATINQKTGQFDSPLMSDIRGKPLDRDHLRNSTDNNYFMNQILNKQSVLPPWVESQKTLDSEIISLRNHVDETWFKWIVSRSPICDQILPTKSKETLLALHEQVRDLKYNIDSLGVHDVNYLRERFNSINSQIRSYNLQSPSANLHKFKLMPDSEISKSFARAVENFPTNIADWHYRNNNKPDLIPWGGVPNSKPEKLNIWQAIKDILK